MAETPVRHAQRLIGLQGPGIDAFLERELPWLAQRGIRTIVSIGGGTVAGYSALAREAGRRARGDRPGGEPLAAPDIEDRGRVFAREGSAAAEVIRLGALHHAL